MTNDSQSFVAREQLQSSGVLQVQDDVRDPRVRARLLRAGYLPLFEGKHIYQFDAAFDPGFRYFVSTQAKRLRDWRQVVWRAIGRATDSRTLIAAPVSAGVYGHSLWSASGLPARLASRLSAVLNSFVVDYYVRMNLSGANIILSVFEGIPVPGLTEESILWDAVDNLSHQIAFNGLDASQRLRTRCSLDALVAHAYGLEQDDFKHVLGCFPALDKRIQESQRQTTLALESFRKLTDVGLSTFISQEWNESPILVEAERPGISAWRPPGGWEQAWAEARQILTADQWAMLTGEFESVQALAEVAAAVQKPAINSKQKRRDGQIRLTL